jgi:very-short-patch-repair endonuclease
MNLTLLMKQPPKNHISIKPAKPAKSNNNGSKQPVKQTMKFWVDGSFNIKKTDEKIIEESKVTMSKLEILFARQFLDKLGIVYTHQFPLNGFYYDFAIYENNSPYATALIEVQGTFYHCDKRVYEEAQYTSQRKQIRIDAVKEEVAALNGFPLIKVWEKDIHESPKIVLEMLRSRLSV